MNWHFPEKEIKMMNKKKDAQVPFSYWGNE